MSMIMRSPCSPSDRRGDLFTRPLRRPQAHAEPLSAPVTQLHGSNERPKRSSSIQVVLPRCVRAGAVAFLVVAVSAVPSPATGSRGTSAQIAGTTGLLRVAAISPWVDATHAFSVTAQVLNQTELTLDGVGVTVSVFGRVATRSQLKQALDGGTPTEALGSFSELIPGSIAPGQQRTVTLQRPATALIGSIARTGVYPILRSQLSIGMR